MPEKRTVATTEILEAVQKLKSEVDVMKIEMTEQHKDKMLILADLTAQVKHTNGRVRDLEMDRERQKAVDAYKASLPQSPMMGVKVETNNAWDWKVVLAIILTLATAAAAIAGVTSR